MFICICLSFVFLLISVGLYARWYYGVLESMGVTVVPTTTFFGSIPDLHRQIIHEMDIKHFKKYGPIYGVYEGRNPVLYVCDPDLIKNVTVKDCEHFKDRRQMDFGDKYFNEIIDFLEYDKWKVVKSQLMPAFSPAKLNSLKTGMDNVLNDFLRSLDQKCGYGDRAKIDIREEAVSYVVGFSSFNLYGLVANDSANKDDFLRRTAQEAMGQDANYSLLYSLSFSFPILTKIAPSNPPVHVGKFIKFIDYALAERNKLDTLPKGDFLDKIKYLLNQVHTDEFKKLKITDITVYSQAIILYIVSYEVLTASFVFLFYYLAKHPNIQEKVHNEIDSFFKKRESLEFKCSSEHELSFLTACIQETLRLVPAQRRLERMCVKDYEYNGIKIKKGVNVMIPLFPCHRNPQYFEDPEEFKPERFLPEKISKLHPFACNIFGHGPRSCGGQRYSMEILRFSAARILRDFRFELRLDTKITFKPGRLFLVQYHPVYLDVVKRCTSFQ